MYVHVRTYIVMYIESTLCNIPLYHLAAQKTAAVDVRHHCFQVVDLEDEASQLADSLLEKKRAITNCSCN